MLSADCHPGFTLQLPSTWNFKHHWVTDNISIDCWASAGYGAEGCAALEAQLRKCMDTPVCSIIYGSVPHNQQLTSTFHNTEIQGAKEEHRQLPPHENVPQGCRSSQEGRCSGLKYSLRDIVHRGSRSELSIGVLGLFLIQYFAKPLAFILLIWVGYFASEAMGVGFYSMYSIQLCGIWNHLSKQLLFSYFMLVAINAFTRCLFKSLRT